MKYLFIMTATAAAFLCFSACNKQYNTVVDDSQTNSNGGSSSGGFNWTGTAPMSAKVNGNAWLGDQVYVASAAGVYYSIGVQNTAQGSTITLSIPVDAKPGKVYSAPAPAGIGGAFPPDLASIAASGKIKMITNNSTTLEGCFYGDLKATSSASAPDSIIHVTEGYFKVNKP